MRELGLNREKQEKYAVSVIPSEETVKKAKSDSMADNQAMVFSVT